MFYDWNTSSRHSQRHRPQFLQLEQRVVPTVDLILDFDGGTLASGRGYEAVQGSPGVNFSGFSGFPASDGSSVNLTEQILEVVAGVREDYAGFDVRVIWDNAGVNSQFFDADDTVLMVVAQSGTSIGRSSSIFGISPYDERQQSRDVALAFLPPHFNISALTQRRIRELIDTISHEAGHTFGLDHSVQSDSQQRQLVTTARQNGSLDSRFSNEVLPLEGGGSYAETVRLAMNVGTTGTPADTQTGQPLSGDTQTISVSANSVVSTNSTINFAGDRDAFRFSAPLTGSLSVVINSQSVSPFVAVFDAEGDFVASGANGLAFNATSGQTYFAVAGTAFDRQMGVAVSQTGDYTLKIGPASLLNPSSGGGPSAGQASPVDLQQNQLIVANLQRVFAQPIPPNSGILAASITSISDVNGDGLLDVSAVVVLASRRGRPVMVRRTFDGASTSAGLIGQPVFS